VANSFGTLDFLAKPNDLLTVISGFALLELEAPAITPGARRALETVVMSAESAWYLQFSYLAQSEESKSG
jgi:hypothetical protein